MSGLLYQAYRNSISRRALGKLKRLFHESYVSEWVHREPDSVDLLSSSLTTAISLNFFGNLFQRIVNRFNFVFMKNISYGLRLNFCKRPIRLMALFILTAACTSTVMELLKGTDISGIVFRLLIICLSIPGLFVETDLEMLSETAFFKRFWINISKDP